MTPDEAEKVRVRLHKLADQVQNHELRLAEQAMLLRVLGDEIERLRLSMATSEQLKAGIAAVTLKLDHLTQSVEPLKRGIYWIVSVILGSVVLGWMALLLRP